MPILKILIGFNIHASHNFRCSKIFREMTFIVIIYFDCVENDS